MKTEQRNIAVESIGLLILYPNSYFHNPSLATSESNEHTFRKYQKAEREFTFECLLHIEVIHFKKTCETYESNL